jgi:hypothetical protein
MTRSIVVGCVTLCVICNVAGRSTALAQSAAPRVDFGLPAESVGWDDVLAGLLSTFDKADVLALGEAHGRQVDSDLRVRLIRHPDFAKKVRFIVVEFGMHLSPAALDAAIRLLDAGTQTSSRGNNLEAAGTGSVTA